MKQGNRKKKKRRSEDADFREYVCDGEAGNMDPKSELGVKKALHPPKTLHF